MQPNNDQLLSMLRWLFTISGPIGAYLVSKGISPENLTELVNAIIVIGGAIPPIISFIWGIKAHTDASKIASVEKMPEVRAKPGLVIALKEAAASPDSPKVVQDKIFWGS